MCSASVKRSPVGSTRLPAPAPPGALAEAGLDLEPAGAEPLVDHQLDVDRAHESVVLVAGVGAGGIAQLAAQGVADLAELGIVVRGQVDREVVGAPPWCPGRRSTRGRPSRGRAGEPARRGGCWSGRRGQRRPPPCAPAAVRTLGWPRPRRLPAAPLLHPAGSFAGGSPPGTALSFMSCRSGEWRNWQTRWLQVPVAARSWGFKSPLAHHVFAGQAGCETGDLGGLLPDFYRCARNDPPVRRAGGRRLLARTSSGRVEPWLGTHRTCRSILRSS